MTQDSMLIFSLPLTLNANDTRHAMLNFPHREREMQVKLEMERENWMINLKREEEEIIISR